ncbi:MAG: diacylglycerol kinase family protein [Planctomycetota bacterium]
MRIIFAIVIPVSFFAQRFLDLVIQKIRLIVSPVSRPGWVKKYLPAVLGVFKDLGLDVEVCMTLGPGDPARLAHEADGVFDAVVVAGGDGSINEALKELAGTATPLGILPFGTVNVFAREMRIPLHPLEAAHVFFKSHAKAFDVGRIGERRFLLMAGYGFDARVLRATPSFLKRVFGRYAYLLTALSLIPFHKDRPVHVYAGGSVSPQIAHFAVFSNARCYAGNYVVAPEADMHDGLLDAILFDCPGRLGLFRIFAALFLNRLSNQPWITRVRTDRIRLESHDTSLFQIDGDSIVVSGDEIVVEKSAIRLVVP